MIQLKTVNTFQSQENTRKTIIGERHKGHRPVSHSPAVTVSADAEQKRAWPHRPHSTNATSSRCTSRQTSHVSVAWEYGTSTWTLLCCRRLIGRQTRKTYMHRTGVCYACVDVDLYSRSGIFQSCIFSPAFSGPAVVTPHFLVAHFPVLHIGPANLTSLVPHFPVPHFQPPLSPQ